MGRSPVRDVDLEAGGATTTGRSPPLTLRDRFLAWRDRLIANPRFQRWAADFPLTRRVARRNADALFDIVAGFVYSQILLACIRLDLFAVLRDGPLSLVEIAQRLKLPTDHARRLLTAAAALDLVQRRSAGRFGLGELGAALLGIPAVTEMVRHHPMFYTDLSDPVALLRGELGPSSLSRFWAYARNEQPDATTATEVTDYTTLMGATQAMVATDILDAYDFDRHRCLLDIGGGDGSFLCAAAERARDLSLMVFDLPAVAEQAERRFAQAGVSERARAVGGNVFRDELPTGADVASLVRVLYDHDDPAVLALLRAAHRALPPGGTLLIAEPFATPRHERRMTDAYFEFYLLAMGSGRPRTPRELVGLLKEAGFRRVKFLRTRRPMLTGLAVAVA